MPVKMNLNVINSKSLYNSHSFPHLRFAHHQLFGDFQHNFVGIYSLQSNCASTSTCSSGARPVNFRIVAAVISKPVCESRNLRSITRHLCKKKSQISKSKGIHDSKPSKRNRPTLLAVFKTLGRLQMTELRR